MSAIKRVRYELTEDSESNGVRSVVIRVGENEDGEVRVNVAGIFNVVVDDRGIVEVYRVGTKPAKPVASIDLADLDAQSSAKADERALDRANRARRKPRRKRS